MAGLTVVDTQSSAADRKFGYRFGVDGIVNLDDALKMLAGCSRATLDRRCEEQKIRKGRDGNRVVFCVRSLKDHIASLER